MRVGLVGVGAAGGRLVEALLSYEASSSREFVTHALAVDTSQADLAALSVPNRLLVGQTHVGGSGTGGDSDLGAEIVQDDRIEIRTALTEIPVHDVDAFVVAAGLGGGTGSSGGPAIAGELDRIYSEPVYGLGALPSTDEERLQTVNAARAIQPFVHKTDSLVLVDNDSWQTGSGFEAVNEDIARRLGILCNAGEVTESTVPESVVDASEIINTLAAGGITAVGYDTTRLETKSGKRSPFASGSDPDPDIDTQNQITTMVRKATLGQLSLPCDVSSTARVLVVIAGPPAYLSRRGIERSRQWLEDETGTMQVRGGDYPVPNSNYLAAVVVLAGVSSVPRIKQLQGVAVETQRAIDDREDPDPEELASESGDDVDPLF